MGELFQVNHSTQYIISIYAEEYKERIQPPYLIGRAAAEIVSLPRENLPFVP